MGKFKPKHGLWKHPLFTVWTGMKDRCGNENSKLYKDYGGRGIGVCVEWMFDFKCFYDWATENGWRNGLELDRRDNNGMYSPNNCRFVTDKINSNNRRSTLYVEYNGEKMPFRLACEMATKLDPRTIWARMRSKNLSFEDALKFKKEMPKGENHFRHKANPINIMMAKRMVLDNVSVREISRKTGISRNTIRSMKNDNL